MTNDFFSNISAKKEIEENKRKKQFSEKILQGEIKIFELTEKETEEMIKYFEKDIEELDIEIEKTKNRIIKKRKELQENNE